MIMVSGAAMSNDMIMDLNAKTIENVENQVKDKIYEIDTISTYNMQNSNNQNRVLVHCAMGMSRSATMVIMYLMRKFKLDWSLAFDIVKIRRDIIDPNEGFIAKLKEYECPPPKSCRFTKYKERTVSTEINEEDELTDNDKGDSETSSSSEDLMSTKYAIDV
uniref:protein-tyrosine-phosphatase n=1 Tax=Euplotes harpa TaxID=151035 RepID=A0A7S3NCI9_9SPIT|mmetsp:Transcript_36904/g.42411  ORF Transcript_36904/g.42411 Transcript_36904/m.42411 type:complete len:162 (+) Transcript_36904:979-1464(+)